MNETLSVTLVAFDNMTEKLKAISKHVDDLVKSFENMEEQAERSQSSIDSLGNSIGRMNTGAGSAGRTLQDTSDSTRDMGESTKSASQQVEELTGQLRRSSGHASIFDKGLGRIAKRVAGIMLVGNAFSMVGSAMDKAMGRLDTFQIFRRNVTNFTGDAQKAEEAINSLNDYTTGTAYALDTASTMVQRMVTSGGKSVEDSVNMTKGWMDIISTYGKGTSDELNQAANALTKMLSKGKVNMLQLNTLTQTIGIPVVRAYAAAVGQSTEEVQEQLSKGQITAEEFESTVRNALLNGVEGFAAAEGMAKIAGSTWEATMANSQNAVARGMQSIIDGVDKAFAATTGVDFKQTYLNIFKTIELVMKSFGSFVENNLPKIIEKFKPLIEMLNTDEGRAEIAENIKRVVKSVLLLGGLSTGIGVIRMLGDRLHNLGIYAKIAGIGLKEVLGIGTKIRQVESVAGTVNIAKTATEMSGKSAKTALTANAVTETGKAAKTAAMTGVAASANKVADDAGKAEGEENLYIRIAATIRKTFSGAFNFAVTTARAALKNISTAWKTLITLILNNPIVKAIISILQPVINAIKYVIGQIITFLGLVIRKIQEIAMMIYEFIAPAIEFIVGIAAKIANFFVLIYQKLMIVLKPVMLLVQGFVQLGTAGFAIVGLIGAVAAVSGAITTGLGALNANGKLAANVGGFFDFINGKARELGDTANSSIIGFSDKVLGRLNAPVTDEQGNVDEGYTNYAALYAQRGVELMGAFTNGVINTVGTMTPVLVNTVLNIADFLIKLLPIFVRAGFTLVQNIITGITTEGPKILSNIGSWIIETLFWLNSKLPQWLQIGAELVKNIVQGIGETAILLFNAIPQLILGVVTVFKEKGPVILQQGALLVWNIIKGIGNMIGSLFQAGVDLLFSFLSALTSDPAGTLNTCKEIVFGIAEGIGRFAGTIFDLALSIGKDFIQWIWNGIVSFWNNLVENFTNLWNQWFGDKGQVEKDISIGVDTTGVDNKLNETKEKLNQEKESVSENPIDIPADNQQFETKLDQIKDMIGSTREEVSQNPVEVPMNLVGTDQLQTETQNAAETIAGTTDIPVEASLGSTDAVNNQLTDTVDTLSQNNHITLVADFDLSQVTSNTKETITAAFTDVQNELNSVIDLYETAMAGKVNTTADQISQMIVNSFSGVRNSFVGTMEGIVYDTGNNLESMNQEAVNKLNFLRQVIIDILGTIAVEYQNRFSQIRDSLSKTLQSLTLRVEERMAELGDRMNLRLMALGNTMEAEFSSSSIRIRKIYSDMVVAVISETSAMGRDMNARLVRGFSVIEGNYGVFTKHIRKLLVSLSNFHRNVGEQFMTDLADGIESKKQAVIDTTSDLVQKMKEVFVKGLGINSPSKWGYYVGEMTGIGYINGLSETEIAKFVASIINDMKASFENGSFDPRELVRYLDDDTLKVIEYLKLNGDETKGGTKSTEDNGLVTYPLAGTLGTISSYFGLRDSPGGIGSTNHQGMDIAAPQGTPIVASLDGVVVQAGWNGGYGNSVTIDHGNGTTTLYGHMSSVSTTVGAPVSKGELIGLVGSTGRSTGPHLHFETRVNGKAVDPSPYLAGSAHLEGTVQNTLVGAIQRAYNEYKGISSFGAFGDAGNIAYNPSAGVAQWSSLVSQALAMLGQDQGLLPGILYAIENESSGNPNAINDWDTNWQAGTPSKGLMQVIDPTFRQYAVPGYDSNIWDPLSNILAGLNYMIGRYGSIERVISARKGGWKGYKVGTRNVPYDMPAFIHEGEAILPKSQNPYSESGGNYLRDIGRNIIEGARSALPVDNGKDRSRDSIENSPLLITSVIPETGKLSERSDISEITEITDNSYLSELSDIPETVSMPVMPETLILTPAMTVPAVPTVENINNISETPIISERADNPLIPDISNLSDITNITERPIINELSVASDKPESPVVTNISDISNISEMVKGSDRPVITRADEGITVSAVLPEIPQTPELLFKSPEAAESFIPAADVTANIPDIPVIPQIPEIPDMPKIPDIPEIPEIPVMTETAEMTDITADVPALSDATSVTPLNPLDTIESMNTIETVKPISNTEPISTVSDTVYRDIGNILSERESVSMIRENELTGEDGKPLNSAFTVPLPTENNSSSVSDNSTQNITFNITNKNDVDADNFIGSLEGELHRMLVTGRARRGGLS